MGIAALNPSYGDSSRNLPTVARSMYFNINQYPAMRDKSKGEQRNIVGTALRKHDRWLNKRLLFASCCLLGLVGGGVQLTQRYFAPAWVDWLIFVLAGLLFYAYILWEINGPVRRAVEKHVSEQR